MWILFITWSGIKISLTAFVDKVYFILIWCLNIHHLLASTLWTIQNKLYTSSSKVRLNIQIRKTALSWEIEKLSPPIHFRPTRGPAAYVPFNRNWPNDNLWRNDDEASAMQMRIVSPEHVVWFFASFYFFLCECSIALSPVDPISQSSPFDFMASRVTYRTRELHKVSGLCHVPPI